MFHSPYIRTNDHDERRSRPSRVLSTTASNDSPYPRLGSALTLAGQHLRNRIVHASISTRLGKVGGDYAIGQKRVPRRWQTLTWTKEAHQKLNRTSHDTAATDDPALTWEATYSRVNGQLPLDDLPKYVIHKEQPATTFLRCELEVTTAGKVQLSLANPAGLAMWVDGKPTPVAATNTLDLPVGRRVLTFAVDRVQHPQPLAVELQDVPGSAIQVQFVHGK